MNHLWHFFSSTLFTTRCEVWCSKWWLLPHRVLQWLLEPSEGLLSHQRDPDKSATAPHLLPAVTMALAAVRSTERSLSMELPARGHVRAVRWRSRFSQGKRSRVTKNWSRCEKLECIQIQTHVFSKWSCNCNLDIYIREKEPSRWWQLFWLFYMFFFLLLPSFNLLKLFFHLTV